MKAKNIKVTTGSREDMAKEFIDVWHQAESGQIPETVEEKIYFKDDNQRQLQNSIFCIDIG